MSNNTNTPSPHRLTSHDAIIDANRAPTDATTPSPLQSHVVSLTYNGSDYEQTSKKRRSPPSNTSSPSTKLQRSSASTTASSLTSPSSISAASSSPSSNNIATRTNSISTAPLSCTTTKISPPPARPSITYRKSNEFSKHKQRNPKKQQSKKIKPPTASKHPPSTSNKTKGSESTSSVKKKNNSSSSSLITTEFYIWARKDVLGLDFKQRQELNYQPTTISKYRLSFRNELVHNFEQTRKVKPTDDGRVMRSSTPFDFVEDTEAFNIHTTKRARLSRYMFEDFIKCRAGEPFMFYVAKSLNSLHKGVFKKSSDQQIKLGIAGGEKKISSKLFYSLRSTLSYCPLHDEVNSSFLTEKQFEKHFDQNEGFRIDFDGTVDPNTNKCYSLTLAWKQIIEDADDILFFGRPFDGTRPYHRLFRNKVDVSLLHHVFFQLSRETRGDTIQSSQLYAAYMERITAVLEDQLNNKEADIPNVTTSRSRAFFKRFDKLCATGFTRCVTGFNDYTQPIILQQDLYVFLRLCPVVFPFQWKYLLKLRGVDVNHKDYIFDDNCPKHRQVMFQIMMIKRMANKQALTYWALIQSVALYGWGVGRAATDATSHFGITLSSTTRDRKTATFTNDNVERMHCLLRKEIAPLFCYDNFQKGIKLLHMRGGHSSNFLKGTHEITHKVRLYDDRRFNQHFVELNYLPTQSYPSPHGMACYETVEQHRLSNFFVNHASMQSAPEPDFSGDRVRSYIKLRDIANRINQISSIFNRSTKHFDIMPARMSTENVLRFQKVVQSDGCRIMIHQCTKFQELSVSKWNPHAGEVTESAFMGLVCVDESDSKGCGAITLDLLLKAGIINREDDGSWKLAWDWKTRRPIIFGDAKTTENMAKFMKDMQGRELSLTEESIQLDIWLRALDLVLVLPGDWHAGMNMLQSIYKVFYNCLLSPIQTLLGWKRITADVRNCYYQASRLVKFVHDEIIRYLMHTFVSDNLQTYFSGDNEQMSDQDRLCKIAIDFSEHLNSLKQAEDEWTRVCVIFVIMAGDFLQFVSAYRNADSIGVEIGYHIFAPVWKELSQSKYLERHWDQQDFLFRKFPFSRLQEARINRFVRRYPIETGKSNLAQDECLEIGNKFYATFPDVQTLDGFARQGNYVGPSLMCKRFVTMFYSSIATNDTTVFVQGSAPDMSPEKKMLYEIISLFLGEHASSDTRTFTSDSLSPSKLKPHLKTDLKRKKLDQAVSSNRVDSASQLLNFMNHMNVKDINPPVDVEGAMAENDDNVNIDPDEVEGLRAIAEDLMSSVVFSGERESDESPQCTKELHHACLIDIWAVGTNKIIAMNPMSIRMEAENRSERKKMVSQYIIDQVNRMKRDVSMIEIGGEMTDCENAPWTKFVMDARK